MAFLVLSNYTATKLFIAVTKRSKNLFLDIKLINTDSFQSEDGIIGILGHSC